MGEADSRVEAGVARFVAQVMRDFASGAEGGALSLPEQRALSERVRAPWRAGGPEMARQREHFAKTPVGRVRLRFLEPIGESGPRPAMIYLHGGGFTTFSLDTHDRLMREYAARAGVVVIGVDYSLSPEARFPQALNEVAGVVAWLADEGARLGVDAGRLALGGDSAGANLAVSACLKLRALGQAGGVRGLLLNYGFFDADLSTPSQRRYGESGAFLSSEELDAYLVNYLGAGDPRSDPLALPILADLSNLPPSFHVIAECDPLCDGDLLMAERMARAGNRVSQTVYGGATHSFLEAVSVSQLAERAISESSSWLRALLFPSAA